MRVRDDPEEDVGGLLRSRENGKEFAEIKYNADGTLPDPITEADMCYVKRPLLGNGTAYEERLVIGTEKFVQVSFPLVLDCESDGICNFRVFLGGSRDTHPKGKELMTRVKDARIVLKKKDRNQAIVFAVAERDSSTPVCGTSGLTLEFNSMKFSSFAQKGDILLYSMLPQDAALHLVLTMEEDALKLVQKDGEVFPPTAVASEVYLGDESRSLVTATPMEMTIAGGTKLELEDGHWVCTPGQDATAVMVGDPIEDVDYRVEVQLMDPGDASGDEYAAPGPYVGFQQFPAAAPLERRCVRVDNIAAMIGEDPDEREDEVELAGGVSAWITQVLGVL